MTINMLFFAISIALPTQITTNDRITIGAVQFSNNFDNYTGAIDIYYSFTGSPSNLPSIQIMTQSEHLVTHQMTTSDFHSGDINTIGGNIYKYTFDISSIQHTNIYYINLVTTSNISYSGSTLNMYANGVIYNYDNNYYNGFSTGYEIGYETGYGQGDIDGYTRGVEETNFEFNLSWLSSIFQVVTNFLNVEILPGFKLGYIIFVPLVIGVVYKLFELLR